MKSLNVGVIGLGIGEQHIIGYLNQNPLNQSVFLTKIKKKCKKFKKNTLLKKSIRVI